MKKHSILQIQSYNIRQKESEICLPCSELQLNREWGMRGWNSKVHKVWSDEGEKDIICPKDLNDWHVYGIWIHEMR